MKKLIALLMACTTMTCMFASCGDKEEDSSVSDESSVSEESVDETTTEETTEEETTEETTEAETEEETTEEETEEKTTHEYIDADATAFLGKWECEKIVAEGEEMTDFMGIPVYAMFQLEIKEDNTASMPDTMAELSLSEEYLTYTWGMVSETEIEIVNTDGDSMLLTLDGDYLIGTEEGSDEQLYLVNVDEFTPFDFEEFMNSFELGDGTDTEDVAGEEESETSEADETEESAE